MGYDLQQTLTAIKEAEEYDGPSIVIAYAPCINHGIRGGMCNTQLRSKAAVEAGYWHCYRYNPDLKKAGKNPFILDSKEPTANLEISSWVRCAILHSSGNSLSSQTTSLPSVKRMPKSALKTINALQATNTANQAIYSVERGHFALALIF